jgi:hypothetical protein
MGLIWVSTRGETFDLEIEIVLTRFFSLIGRLLLRLEDFLESRLLHLEDLLKRLLKWLASVAPIWLSALILCCAGSIVAAVLTTGTTSLEDRLFGVELGFYAGLGPAAIVAICGSFAPRRLAFRIVLVGSGITCILALWLFHMMWEAMASIG